MAPNKRKGLDVSDDSLNNGPAFIVVENNDLYLDGMKKQLRRLREEQCEDDPLLSSIENIDENLGDAEEKLIEEASQIKTKLREKIDEAQAAYKKESGVLKDLKNQINRIEEKRRSLFEGMQELEKKQMELQKKIALHQEESSQEIESIDKVEEERKRSVPRLKTQISLYASTTGIKWDFAQEDVLSGSVAIPDQQGLKFFSIDPREHSPNETADRLWRMMDGLD